MTRLNGQGLGVRGCVDTDGHFPEPVVTRGQITAGACAGPRIPSGSAATCSSATRRRPPSMHTDPTPDASAATIQGTPTATIRIDGLGAGLGTRSHRRRPGTLYTRRTRRRDAREFGSSNHGFGMPPRPITAVGADAAAGRKSKVSSRTRRPPQASSLRPRPSAAGEGGVAM